MHQACWMNLCLRLQKVSSHQGLTPCRYSNPCLLWGLVFWIILEKQDQQPPCFFCLYFVGWITRWSFWEPVGQCWASSGSTRLLSSPLPIPGSISIYGLCLVFFFVSLKIVKVCSLKEVFLFIKVNKNLAPDLILLELYWRSNNVVLLSCSMRAVVCI